MDLVYDYQEGRDSVENRLPFDIEKLLNYGVVFVTPAIDGDPDSPTYKEFTGEDYSHLITLYNLIHSSPEGWVRKSITKRGDVLPWKDKFWEKIYDGKYNQILWSLDYLDIDPNDMLIEYPIDEELARVRELIESLAK
jgi:hypothetical protein